MVGEHDSTPLRIATHERRDISIGYHVRDSEVDRTGEERNSSFEVVVLCDLHNT